MKKLICLLLCLLFPLPRAFAEEPPRRVEEGGAGYAWLYETSLTVAGRFQRGLNSAWHSFLLSAANVPQAEMEEALALLRMQDYTQPWDVTVVRADQPLPGETVQAWQEAIAAEEAAKAARAAQRAEELISALAEAKTAAAASGAAHSPERAVKTAERASKAADLAVRFAIESGGTNALRSARSAIVTAERAVHAAIELDEADTATAAQSSIVKAEIIIKKAISAEAAAEKNVSAEETADGGWDDWERWDLGFDSPDAAPREEDAAAAADDSQRELYHSTPAILNSREDGLFSAISGALKVTGLYPCPEALDGPCYAVVYYGGLYALLVTFFPAGDGFVSVSAQAVYSRSADGLNMPRD